jgi:hypothetical protein
VGRVENIPLINMVLDKLLMDGSQAFVMNPKKDLYGLGFDPFKDAPEFRGKITIFLVSIFVSIWNRDSMYCKHREFTKFSFCRT